MEEDTPIGMREIQLHSDYTMDIEIERNALTLDAVNYIYEEALRLHQKDNGVLN